MTMSNVEKMHIAEKFQSVNPNALVYLATPEMVGISIFEPSK